MFWKRKQAEPQAPRLHPALCINPEVKTYPSGTCSWWPRGLERTGVYHRLNAGPYSAEAIELTSGKLYVCMHSLPEDERVVATLADAIEVFRRQVSSSIRSFTTFEMVTASKLHLF